MGNFYKFSVALVFVILFLSACSEKGGPTKGPINHAKLTPVPMNTQLYHRGPYGSAKFLRTEFKISQNGSRYLARLYETYENTGPWANFIDVYDRNSGKLVCSVLVGNSELAPRLRDGVCFPNRWIPKPYRKGGSQAFVKNFLEHFNIDEKGCSAKRIPAQAQGCWSIAEKSDWEYWLRN